MTGFSAKRAGKPASENMKRLGINWVTYRGERMTYRTPKKGTHYQLVVRATWAKINQTKGLKTLLLRTNGLTLRPDHRQKANPPPAWQYYKILMDIREALASIEG